MTFGAEIWGPPLINAAGSITSGYMQGRSGGQETKMQKTKRKLLDELINSLNGEGAYSDLYKTDYDSFNKAFVEPAQAKFNNQIAPMIQQQYIASGQHRGTGLDDTLTRAGVDLDTLLNQHLMEYQQGAMNRKQSGINTGLSAGDGGTQNMSPGQSAMQATSGYFASDAFSKGVNDIFKAYTEQNKQPEQKNIFEPPARKGYAQDWSDWKLGDPRWGS